MRSSTGTASRAGVRRARGYDFGIVGAGIVGLATALRLRERHPGASIAVFDKEGQVAAHQTGHNSGVIHSGVYYRPGSLKAATCLRGYALLLAFLRKHRLPYELCGKVIVATDEKELHGLRTIHRRGRENGLADLQLLDTRGLHTIEPHAAGIAALYVPQSGITDYAMVARRMAALLRASSVDLHLSNAVTNVDVAASRVRIRAGGQAYEIDHLVNCAGLYSDRLARLTGQTLNYRIVPFRGEYYDLLPHARRLVRGLIYPVPDPAFPFLGVHFTKTIHGGVESGPNAVFATSREGYRRRDLRVGDVVEAFGYRGMRRLAARHWRAGAREVWRSLSKAAYVRSLRKLIPEITGCDVTPSGAGVRAQAVRGDGTMVDDFLVIRSERVTNVCNAPSPAATASLAIAEHIVRVVEDDATAAR